jgi:starch phosphorylase
VGDRYPYSPDQDEAHATTIYSLLENDIVPTYYERDQGVPREWMRHVKRTLAHLTPQYNARRVVEEYMSQLYRPAHLAYRDLAADGFQKARQKARWNEEVGRVWSQVRFVELGGPPDGPVLSGRPVPVRAAMDLAGLKADDVRVEVVIGRIGAGGQLEDTEVLLLPPVAEAGHMVVFEKEIIPRQTGRLGFAVRVSPNHHGDPLSRPCGGRVKWAGAGV